MWLTFDPGGRWLTLDPGGRGGWPLTQVGGGWPLTQGEVVVFSRQIYSDSLSFSPSTSTTYILDLKDKNQNFYGKGTQMEVKFVLSNIKVFYIKKCGLGDSKQLWF